ncbi:hypothetical protein D9758_002166 [Tetrapyrgos nigripes]|uniref:Endonuclease/exonuclease/phosphatase domain-containing protein n=1 Tax=Tetrapyrgos nigripes TaxID=182062 RepID=A0A8H5GP08_9AGAR|nr:hypothetical protein D9758_002166 [Tetrapyrgos nigripes]
MSETSLNVFTMNCWGLKYVSKYRSERVTAIANELANSPEYDIVALQELWVYADYELVRARISSHLPYAKFFYSGALGAGLAIFSRHPIIGAEIHPYSLNGEPMDVTGGDWMVGKAAASAIISHPILGHVQVINTHLYAKGGEDGPEHKRAHRLMGSWEFAKIARHAAELGRYVIAVGDFNSIPSTLPITIIRQHADLSDAWLVAHPFSASANPSSTPQEAIDDHGITADSPINSWSSGKNFDVQTRQNFGKRLDYIFYRQPKHSSRADGIASIPTLRCTDCRVMFTHEVGGTTYSHSDHFGLRATLEIQTPSNPLPSASLPDVEPSFSEAQNAWSTAPAASSSTPSELSDAVINTILESLAQASLVSKRRSRKELSIFVMCLIILVAVIVGSPWFPHSWISPIFMVFNIFIAWVATTMLYEGFIFGNWEFNAYMNTIEELELHQKMLEMERQ